MYNIHMRIKTFLFLFTSMLCVTSCSSGPVETRLDRIEVTTAPSKVNYNEGDYFNPEGMVVTAFYTDSTSKIIDNYTYLFDEPLNSEEQFVKLTYQEEQIVKTTNVNINVKEYTSSKQIFENVPLLFDCFAGETMQLYPQIKSGYTSNNNFEFFVCGKGNSLGVDQNGLLTSYYEGTQKLVIYSDDNYNGLRDETEEYQVSVITVKTPDTVVNSKDIYLNTIGIDGYVNFEYHLETSVLPNDATYKKIKYIASNDVVTVFKNGRIICNKLGFSKITIYNDVNNNNVLDSNELSKVCFVSVINPEVSRTITLPENEVTIKVGETYKILPTLTPSTTSYYSLYSSNSKVALTAYKNNECLVKGIFPGTSIINIRFEGAQASMKVNVVLDSNDLGKKAAKVALNSTDLALNVGETYELNATLVPSNAIDELRYESSNPDVVSVNDQGKITANKDGAAIVSCTAEFGASSRKLIVVSDKVDYGTGHYDNYYGDLTWENGDDLANKLHNIISKNFTKLNYAGTPTNWESNSYADEDIENTSNVKAIYSTTSIGKTNHGTGTGKWQREHCYAASLLMGVSTGPATTDPGRATDFHNLYAAGSSGNSSRGNKDLGYADTLSPSYTVSSGYSYDNHNFEPQDTDKGKVARSIFYMSVMYNSVDTARVKESWTFKSAEDIASHTTKSKTLTFNIDLKPLNITPNYIEFDRTSLNNFMAKESGSDMLIENYYSQKLMEKGTSYEVGSDEFRRDAYALFVSDYSTNAIGNLYDLLKWNSFNVDKQEQQHCESVYSHVGIEANIGKKQGNRNPFVDYPQLVYYVFGPLQNVGGNIKNIKPSIEK